MSKCEKCYMEFCECYDQYFTEEECNKRAVEPIKKEVEEVKPYKMEFIAKLEVGCLDMFESFHDTMEEAEKALDLVANYTLFLHDKRIMEDYTNMGSVLMYNDTEFEWQEIDKEDL